MGVSLRIGEAIFRFGCQEGKKSDSNRQLLQNITLELPPVW